MVGTDELTPQALDEIKRKSFLGVIALTSRTFALQVIALVSTFILTVLLAPEIFGIFFVVTAAINFLNYFSDIGLAAALIQKKEEPKRIDYVTTFTIQQILVGTSVIIALLFSRTVSSLYHIGEGGLFLFRALAFSFFLSSLKTIPSVMLERRLDFHKLVIPQILETFAFYAVAIILALKGNGVVSFAWAAVTRGIVGTTVLYILVPWKPGLKLDKLSAKALLSFGLPYQANSFLALIKDDLLTLFLGLILPFTAVGYIGWAKKWSEIALRLVMDNIIKVTFPAFSRLQNRSEKLAKGIQKSLSFLALLSLPIAIGMVFMVKPLIEIIPRYGKWEPALISFYLFTISSVLATLSSPLVNALNAIGKVKYTFYLMIMWTVLTWIFVPVAVRLFGFNGVAIAAVFIGLTSFVPLLFIRRFVRVTYFTDLLKPSLATIGMASVLGIVFMIFTNSYARLILGILSGAGIYVLLIQALMGEELKPFITLLRERNKK